MWTIALSKVLKSKITWIVVALLIVALIAWSIFKKESSPNALPIPEGDLSESEQQTAARMADELYHELKGIGSFNNYVAEEFAQMTDRMTIAVSNRFNEIYFEKKDRTLKEWLDKESLSGTSKKFINDIVLPKMTRLNIE